MIVGRAYLAAFVELPEIASVDERRHVARQGLATLAELAEREPAPLEGVAAAPLARSVRRMLDDGLLDDLGWLAPASAAVALSELAQALPVGAERRELGRRVLTRLREADRDTFVRLLIALARSSPRLVAGDNLRARLEVALSAPLTAPGRIGDLALGLLAQPVLAQSWVEAPATGSLPSRRLAARILAHGAREAVRRHDEGDHGGVRVLARPATRDALARLLGDREALVWRFASIARGILAHVDPVLADDIDRELRPTASNTELRRAAASAAAALERGGAATRWIPMIVARAAKEPGVARGAILGLAGLAVTSPDQADALARDLVHRAPLEGAETLADLRREESAPLLPSAAAEALAWTVAQRSSGTDATDDGRQVLLSALEAELSGTVVSDSIGTTIVAARDALDRGDVGAAMREARAAVQEIAAAARWFDTARDDTPADRQQAIRLLRVLDREIFTDNALYAALALTADQDPLRGTFASALATIERALLARERAPETTAVAHTGLRVARLRALVRVLDGVRVTGDADLAPRLAAVRQLMDRARLDRSSLRRAVWAALTRAGDALLRDGHAELTDLVLAWTTSFVDEDFAIVREASMVPELEATLDAYGKLDQATWAAADPDDDAAARAVLDRLGDLADALPPEQSPRVESVRLALVRLGNGLRRLVVASSQASVVAGTFDAIASELGTLSRRVYSARHRLGLPAEDVAAQLEISVRSIDDALASPAARGRSTLDDAVAGTIDHVRAALPPALAAAVERVFAWFARRPVAPTDDAPVTPLDVALPGWVPLSRLLGSFHVLRPIGRGAGGSVLLAVRADERTRPDRELVALKVPDYTGEAARALSEAEFEAMFRDEAGALLALPRHRNIARFITFDASAAKPILAMEYVQGTSLERALEARELTTLRALQIVDDMLAGLEAMHRANIAHLDVKPPNILLREGSGEAVLVDFGLAGRRIRPGCASPYYGALEVWEERGATLAPYPADVYSAAAVAFEVFTGTLLVDGDSLRELISQHAAPQPGAASLARLERAPGLAPLAGLLRTALSRDAARRPTIGRLRAELSALEPELRRRAWPMGA